MMQWKKSLSFLVRPWWTRPLHFIVTQAHASLYYCCVRRKCIEDKKRLATKMPCWMEEMSASLLNPKPTVPALVAANHHQPPPTSQPQFQHLCFGTLPPLFLKLGSHLLPFPTAPCLLTTRSTPSSPKARRDGRPTNCRMPERVSPARAARCVGRPLASARAPPSTCSMVCVNKEAGSARRTRASRTAAPGATTHR